MSELVEAFRAAEDAVTAERRAWNAMTGEERKRLASAARGGLDELHDAAERAARALIADAVGRHHIEQQAQVYLKLGPTGWVIDSPTFDGTPLEGYDDVVNTECAHYETHDRDLEVECEAVADAAEYINTPTAHELIGLLQDADPGE